MTAKSQIPLRFVQSGRVSCGRGYSGSGLSTGTLFVHGVVMGAGFGSQAAGAAAAGAVPVPTRAVATRANRPVVAVNLRHQVRRRGAGRMVGHPFLRSYGEGAVGTPGELWAAAADAPPPVVCT
ncbi:hypothetical protein GCM10027028_58130 [Streptomyces sundarbansensis]